ncbi:MAG: PilZ domain-containing protein [Planctomycetota bacterium]
MSQHMERRRFERFDVRPMYTPIAVRLLDETDFTMEGHAYDVSEGGVRFDLDRPVAPGTPVVIRLDLRIAESGVPRTGGPGRAVFVFSNTVWLDDSELPGEVSLAAAFTRFAHAGDRERLLQQFASGQYLRRAA